MLGSGSINRIGLVEASVLLGIKMNSDGKLRSKWIIGLGGHDSMLKGDSVRGKLRKTVKLREQAKSCILGFEMVDPVSERTELKQPELSAHILAFPISIPIFHVRCFP